MHKLIRVIVDAADEAEAKSKAESIILDKCGENGQPFDWYNMEPDRWDESGKAYKLTGQKGKKLLKDGFQYQRDEFDNAIKAVRSMLANYTDDQIFHEDFGDKEARDKLDYFASKYQFSRVYDGGQFVYADYGECVETPEQFDKYYKNYSHVVCVDVHY